VIVVDAGSSDSTPQILAERAAAWPELSHLSVPGAAPGRGRNEGIRVARSARIATLDAGCRVGPGWLQSLTSALEDDPEVVAFGVAVADPRSTFERAAGWFTLRAFKPAAGRRATMARYLPAGRNGLAFSAAAWRAAGGYPDDLAWGEDKVFFERLGSSGARPRVVEDARVRWRPRRNLIELYRQYERYSYGDAISGLDHSNTAFTAVLYAVGGALAGAALRRKRGAARALMLAVVGYLGLFVASAARELGTGRSLAWVPAIRITADLGKMRGFLAGSLKRRPAPPVAAPATSRPARPSASD
jgi:glycosyltransferase involved in cell wall biosynthesis